MLMQSNYRGTKGRSPCLCSYRARRTGDTAAGGARGLSCCRYTYDPYYA